MDMNKDLAILIVNRNRPDLTDRLVAQLEPLGSTVSKDIFVVECGSDPDKQSKYASYCYEDEPFRGKCRGHVLGLDWVTQNHGRYEFYWFMMNDLILAPNPDPIDVLTGYLRAESKMGLISPTELDSGYAGSRPQPRSEWRKMSTTDYLAVMMKGACIREVGYMNPDFKYSWGAIHELSHKMYRAEWFIAYCDRVVMKHLGGTTYGQTRGTVSRQDYQKRAAQFARDYFVSTYGENWDADFSACLTPDVEDNYKRHRELFERLASKSPATRSRSTGFAPIRAGRRLLRSVVPKWLRAS